MYKMIEIDRSKISTRFQVVIPDKVRKMLKIHELKNDESGYVYFYENDGNITIKVAVVRKKEEVNFLE